MGARELAGPTPGWLSLHPAEEETSYCSEGLGVPTHLLIKLMRCLELAITRVLTGTLRTHPREPLGSGLPAPQPAEPQLLTAGWACSHLPPGAGTGLGLG